MVKQWLYNWSNHFFVTGPKFLICSVEMLSSPIAFPGFSVEMHTKDGFEVGMVTGIVFVDLSAAYDTVNHRCLLHKILELTKDIRLTELIESMLENRLFFVELGGKKSRWRRLKNGLPQGSVLALLLFNIYKTTNQEVKVPVISSMRMTLA